MESLPLLLLKQLARKGKELETTTGETINRKMGILHGNTDSKVIRCGILFI